MKPPKNAYFLAAGWDLEWKIIPFSNSNSFDFIVLWRTILHILWEDIIDRKQKILVKSSVNNCGYIFIFLRKRTSCGLIGSGSSLSKPFAPLSLVTTPRWLLNLFYFLKYLICNRNWKFSEILDKLSITRKKTSVTERVTLLILMRKFVDIVPVNADTLLKEVTFSRWLVFSMQKFNRF